LTEFLENSEPSPENSKEIEPPVSVTLARHEIYHLLSGLLLIQAERQQLVDRPMSPEEEPALYRANQEWNRQELTAAQGLHRKLLTIVQGIEPNVEPEHEGE
jgi:hypothetical protein